MNRAALIYIRQSRHKVYERTVSPEVQEQECRALPAVKECHPVVIYKDLDVSGGKTKGRAAWVELRERIEAHRKEDTPIVVVLYDQSRSFRNTREALEMYALLERKPWIDVEIVHGHFDRSPAGEFTYTAMAAANAMERRMTAEKIRAAKAYRSAKGEAVGPLPAGYKWDGGDVARQVVIDETTAPIVRRLFAAYATGEYSGAALAHRFNAEGAILPANTGPKELRGKGWHGDTVMQVLGNVAYIGKTYSISRRRQEGEIIPASWPALIDSETWEAVQRHRARHRRKGGRTGFVSERRYYALQGLLRCRCGRWMHAHHVRDNVYYRCRGADGPDQCPVGTVREATILPWARAVMAGLESLAPRALRDQVEGMTAERTSAPSALANVDESLRRADFMFYSAKRWDEAQYLAEVARLTAIREDLTRAIEPGRTPLDFRGVLAQWDGGDAKIRRGLLGSLFDALDIEDGEVAAFKPRADRAADVAEIMECLVATEREGFEPSNRVAPVTAFPVPRPRPD